MQWKLGALALWRIVARARLPLIICALIAQPSVTYGLQAASAVAQFGELRSKMHQDHVRADWRAFRSDAERLMQLLNGSPDGLLEVARADTHIGDQSRALDELRTMTRMGQSQAIVTTLPDFAPLRARADFKSITEKMASNARRVSHASQAFVIPDAGLLPEDIDYDANGRRFFFTSVLEKKIVVMTADGHVADFAAAPDQWPMLALKVDSKRHTVWATEVALDGFGIVSKRDWGRSVLVGYDIDTGRVLSRIPGPAHSAL